MNVTSKLVTASSSGNYKQIEDIYLDLINKKMKLDKFFSMYLDKVGDDMDADDLNTPIWKLYKSKLKEYSELTKAVTVAEYYLKKNNV